MESEKVISIKEIVHWSCHILEHRHKTKEVAEKCMQRHSGESDYTYRRLERRLKWCEVAKKILFGMPLSEAGKIMGVSIEQSRKMFFLTLRESRHSKYEIEELKGEPYYPMDVVRRKPELWTRQVGNYAVGIAKRIDWMLLHKKG